MPFARNGNFLGLLAANTILGAAMPMLIILGGLAGLMLSPTTALATLPASLQTLAGLFAAAPFSMMMGRFGRKTGFVIGVALAVAGALLGVWAMLSGSFILLCAGHLALGAALACFQFFRFAAAEVVSPEWQPVAISLMLTSGLVAAFAGPQLFIMAKDALAPVPLAGAYAAIGLISVIGLVPLAFVRMPKGSAPANQTFRDRLAALAVLRRKPVRRAVAIGAVSQGIMVFLMIPTPLAMVGCGFSEAVAGDVIRWHVVAMFAPSFFTGFLIKRFGTERITLAGLALLVVSAVVALGGLSGAHFYGALVLLGLGWNFGFIGATNMLANVVSDAEKPMAQGANDTVIALASTLCAFAAGAIVAGYGWTVLALAALVILVAALCCLHWPARQPA
ncbi:MFS transporter [Sulfitobacter sp. M57]|nr:MULTISPECIES: MFS transporter [unclassified Sulfitobacter]MDF3415976.1 MFS transporter [Sulfitobacter sp. KE5]MDF3423456.1 MFS transporter [Sulfitobacter sp. KE43]MDF3460162.1 MFS transporter [Sulfitobacter sp. S74]MDF3464060.1 MFS transporter [Sulfitobacter sp. Ks18]MDF3467850.1 MFS transporter [Sulfitobacter sp. M05]MDF3471855.1 MFS transporter [Sulfitobacter sp. M28]MDF3475604.1 MFS transporter [Sulfitobacter sp. M48]MDF3479507.1 MFS transporter [Sulfitobacter sp. M53]MDF3483405.1 MF